MGLFSAYDGLEVERIWVWGDYVRLVFDVGDTGIRAIYIDVTDFEFTAADGTMTYVDVGVDPLSAGPVLGVLRRRVTRASVENWVLSLSFDDGARLVCRPDEHYEAWAAQVPGEERGTWDCPPGGGSDSPT